MKPVCKCGCGMEINLYRGVYPIYKKGHSNKKYQFNRNTFSEINTEEDAYWLGFFFADGFVKDRGSFGFDLSIKDKVHLERFKDYIGTNQPIIDKNEFCRLEIADKDYLSILAKYGLRQGKSFTICMPELKHDLYCHFIRGVFDGDGWIAYSKTHRSLQFGIVGCMGFMQEIQIRLVEECGLSWIKLLVDKRHKSKEIASIAYGGNTNCMKIFDYLYSNSTVFLERKEVVWKSYLPHFRTMN